MGRKRAGKMRSVSQQKNRSDFTTLRTGCLHLTMLRKGWKALIWYQGYPTAGWQKPGGFPQLQRIPQKVLPVHTCLSTTSGKGCLPDQVRQARVDVAPEPAALLSEQPPSSPAMAMHRLPTMGSLLMAFPRPFGTATLTKTVEGLLSMSHASCDSLCTFGLNIRKQHLPLFPVYQ